MAFQLQIRLIKIKLLSLLTHSKFHELQFVQQLSCEYNLIGYNQVYSSFFFFSPLNTVEPSNPEVKNFRKEKGGFSKSLGKNGKKKNMLMVCFSKTLNSQCLQSFAEGECPCFVLELSILNFLVVFALLDCLCLFSFFLSFFLQSLYPFFSIYISDFQVCEPWQIFQL